MKLSHIWLLIILVAILGVLIVFIGIGTKKAEDGIDNIVDDTDTGPGIYPGDEQITLEPVIYTDSGYDPPLTTIRKGSMIVFDNRSEIGMYTVADNQDFQSPAAIPSGLSWSHIFTEPGTWTYHNLNEPEHTGTIIVR